MDNYCCKVLEQNSVCDCKEHLDKYACPDVLIDYHEKTNKFGIIVHDGGTSMVEINYCPWCGTKLVFE
jgi:hypothetical protein